MARRMLSLRGAVRARDLRAGAGAPAPVPDPDFASVSLLLGFEGADESTTFTDESSDERTITVTGDCQIDTAQKKFQTSSLLIPPNGTDDKLDAGLAAEFAIADRAMTFEFFLRLNEVDRLQMLLNKRHTSGAAEDWWSYMGADNKLVFHGWDVGVVQEIAIGTTALVVDTWYHVAFVTEADGTWSIYLDGVLEDATVAGVSVSTHVGTLKIGGQPVNPQRDLNGWMDELRITTGVARYTANFTPPAAAFPRS